MNRRAFLFSVVVFWLSVGAAGMALGQTGQDDILKMIPEEAVGFVLVNRLQETSDKIDEIAKPLPVPPPSLLASLCKQLSMEKGLDKARSAALVVMPGESIELSAPVLLVPVTNYKEFISQFEPKDAAASMAEITLGGSALLAAPQGAYAAMTESNYKAALQKYLNSKRNMSGTLPKPLVGWLAKNEASLVVMPSGIKQLSALGLAQLAQAKLKQAQPPAPGAPAMPFDMGFAAFSEDILKAMPAEASHAGIGLWIDPSNAVHLTTRVMFVPDGNLAREGKNAKPPTEDLFEHIPLGPYVFAWGSSAKTSLARKMMELSTDMMRSNPLFSKLTDEQIKQIKDATAAASKGVDLNSGVMGVPEGKDSMYANTVMVLKVDDSATYLANNEKLVKAMSDIMKGLNPPPMKYEIKMGKLDDLPMLTFAADMSQMLGGAPPGMTPGIKNLFGPDGKLTTYVVAIDKKTILTAYVSEDNVRKMVARYRKGGKSLHSDPEVAKTAAVLPNGSQMRGYLSLPGLAAFGKSVMNNMGSPFGGFIPEVPDMPPIGLAARIAPAGLATDLIVPGELFEAIGGIARSMRPPGAN